MKREMNCIVCPMGCRLTVEYTGEDDIKVTGNTCPRGVSYAKAEIVSPTRTLTTTVKTVDGRRVPVKSAAPLPKPRLFEFMDLINSAEVKTPVHIGEVIIKNIGSTGIDIVATRNID